MKLVLGSLLVVTTAAAAAPVQLCTPNRMVVSEYEKVLYADQLRYNSNEQFEYDPTTKLLKVKSNGQCVCADNGS
ncbi:hypothetical protein SDRG_01052 [Saprolegnia diclina VS20]|uniref:Uncharacterized protein n=1 Tax=Saprolegnia diclina (strain VS20) TaxID=1156394 RepID=T0QVF8_SAPDV|nr:hypothetical protein SDRG_01051 [Saprolegnia diclina VS20]XP_008604783.1 hypothetical protein SDRG_01052 [Saprolegnia diclina VS20]EQC42213.1 hypothetical protein SDRG_01051 [Saprolegnia diclina VS20]EQC42214.1 hypothetical protein SDRG_01052 [Saprolegnia diclina VS20]|eukprot:XP_008604782.1 hypothetical protein SDRG_01051 [Saprolegnia diclina VS20]